MSNARAFGGQARARGELTSPYAANPHGKGFVLRREDAAGVALPNLEEIDQLVTAWNQTPLPAGLAPLSRQSGLRLDGGGFAVDTTRGTVQLRPEAFSFAHPRMKLPAYPAGEALELVGMTHNEPLRLTLPPARFAAEVTLGDARHVLPLQTDTLCLFPDFRRLFVVARRAFVYEVLPERPRAVRVFAADAPIEDTSTTIAAERNAPAPAVELTPVMESDAMPLPFAEMLALYPLSDLLHTFALCASG